MLTSPLSLALGALVATLAGSSTGAAPCPSLADIETAMGLPVRNHPMVAGQCMYEFTGRYQGAFVTLSYQPASRANDLFAAIRQRVKVKGLDAKPDRLTIGEGGWGYRSRGRQEAAAVSNGRVYHADVEYDLLEESMRLREDGAIRVIELAMRAAPAE